MYVYVRWRDRPQIDIEGQVTKCSFLISQRERETEEGRFHSLVVYKLYRGSSAIFWTRSLICTYQFSAKDTLIVRFLVWILDSEFLSIVLFPKVHIITPALLSPTEVCKHCKTVDPLDRTHTSFRTNEINIEFCLFILYIDSNELRK